MPIVQMFNKELAPSQVQALKFGLWIGMASIIMLFGALTSAFLVRRGVGNWYEYKLPIEFFYSTVIIVISSIVLEFCFRALKRKNEKLFKQSLIASFVLGIGFIASQIIAVKNLLSQGLYIDLNVSISFLYVIAGLHALHLLGGLVTFIISILLAFTSEFAVNDMKILKFDLLRQYWHFLGVLWIYLLVFLILQ
ncbi:MAG: cytochrome oxidase subunit III [Saprospiraceae bacterium]|nr:cytochrome oxidase subunit III [Saprospiraceae bacterium]